MASNTINNGKFYIFNLITQEGQYVAIIPDFWFFDDSCYYPNMGGDIAASKRKQPERSWTHYKCSFRGEFESFKEARRRLPRAVEFSDLNTASEADDNMYGRGKRKKRPRQVYSPAEDSASEEDNISDTENNTSNNNLQDSQSQFATSGFLTSTQYPDEQESQVINSLNGSPTQGQMEADDSNTLNCQATITLPLLNSSPSVPDRSIIPLLPVNSTVADAARALSATSYTQLRQLPMESYPS
ncbi:hypothetical protein OUZ56_026572 [Daphnia magna]|uniref:Uncharacterized protein n=1 Tax=Daphnia magna TaxID=35525 RepID=A0ABQ9ZMA1_9CRUS|nr:hypothetical protein OUZ56_026572 [Daphnia magna]